ncbi:aminoglycoside phosphotransferase [Jeotgalibacillus soli]|uniref:Aminoglycoside phosphotransferase n=1 Tax=Jeotgalibacillus soli TaxID=889306 RepID=A0A0C2RS89_9BACL|nr:aminoglycoside phosphotransferase [Jeotgalibacillus soli]
MEIGAVKELALCYSIFSFIEGEDAKTLMPEWTKEVQYMIGLEAGKDHARMHLYQAPKIIKPWYERALKKHEQYVKAYQTCEVKISSNDKIFQFIDGNLGIIKNRPNQLQHDDFHLENIIVKDKRYNGVIDFNGYDWGDPNHDIVKIALFRREISIPFSIGQIIGYFNQKIPEDFWRLYAIYVAMTLFFSIVWSIKAGISVADEMMERLHVVLEDHKNFELEKPGFGLYEVKKWSVVKKEMDQYSKKRIFMETHV